MLDVKKRGGKNLIEAVNSIREIVDESTKELIP